MHDVGKQSQIGFGQVINSFHIYISDNEKETAHYRLSEGAMTETCSVFS
jgi:stress response protein SCP2